ncbi:hypothetical protein GCM10027168_14850 [Streptomyces capparidis]
MGQARRFGEGTGAAVAAVSLGGVLGALARYGAGEALPAAPGAFPWAVFWVNVSGCALLGALLDALRRARVRHPLARPFWGVGVLGGFTTFSTYAEDTRRLLGGHHYGVAVAYCLVSVAAGLLAVRAGAWAAGTWGTGARGAGRR